MFKMLYLQRNHGQSDEVICKQHKIQEDLAENRVEYRGKKELVYQQIYSEDQEHM